MSIIKVSQLGQTNTVTSGSLFYVSLGDQDPRISKHITEEDLFGQYATTGSNNFLGSQNITGSLFVSDTPLGSSTDNMLVINPTTKKVSYVAQPKVMGGLYAQTANSEVISGTANESDLIGFGVGSLFIPANGFSVGDSFLGEMGGLISTVNNETFRLRVKTQSGVVLTDSGIVSLPSTHNQVWSLTTTFTVRTLGPAGIASIVSIGKFQFNNGSNGSIEGFAFNTVNQTTFNTVVDNSLRITVEFGSNNPDNSIFSDVFTLTKTY